MFAAMDNLNNRFARNSVILASQCCEVRSFDTKRAPKNLAWTTRIGEIPEAK
nr:DUF4113 domain-containing protein [Novosphingobium sp. ST904]